MLCVPFRLGAQTLRRISGALDPKAISVKFATVAFHTFTWHVLAHYL